MKSVNNGAGLLGPAHSGRSLLKTKKAAIPLLAMLFLAVLLQACGAYSFTGATLPPTIKTISIQPFYNDTGNGPPNLSQNFTERLRDYFQSNTDLALVEADGDLQLDGSIVGWQLNPVAPTASGNNQPDRAGLQRLSITVAVNFINTQEEEQSFERNFSFHADYDPQQTDFAAEEQRLIDEISETIIFDIFNNTVANW
ncbi:LPS assembly lipoprotein LptE [Nafulsella turpanensis]|uniref:LPS assembly lipoprotein LptE n=1 Tax=Nafulsella turpanensis TaxID=1265690 RepID=UPI00037BB1EC|nr:LptE family protein [Nafulsella turpanensis]